VRTLSEAAQIKALTDVRYNKPPITIEELMQARMHMIFMIDVDSATIQELDPETYVRTASAFLDWHRGSQGLNPHRSPTGRGFKFAESAS
jgi:hypothetical protein